MIFGTALTQILRFLNRLRLRKSQQEEPPALLTAEPDPQSAVQAEDVLSIPVCETSPETEARLEVQDRGRYLARQERWSDFIDEVRQADAARDKTPGGMPIADLLLYGARADVVEAAEHSAEAGGAAQEAHYMDGLTALEQLRQEFPDCRQIDLLIALSHIDVGWVRRGTGEDREAETAQSYFNAHLDRAADLLAPYRAGPMDSPALAAACCALTIAREGRGKQLADAFEALIDLDPRDFRHMRAMGAYLLPRFDGSYARLDLEARRTASRTEATWGAGGYAWVYFDAVVTDPEACAQMDTEFFVEGLHDILYHRPDQDMANLLTAFCTIALRPKPEQSEAARQNACELADCAGWLVRDHLRQVHPMIWAHAAQGFDNNARVASVRRFADRGRADALQAIAEQFRDDIERGLNVTFTPSGPKFHRA